MDKDEELFFRMALDFLGNKMSFDTSQETYRLSSGDNSVIMRGEMAGHSLGELKEYVAKKLGKKIEWNYD